MYRKVNHSKSGQLNKSHAMDMLNGPLLWKIFLFAMPLAFSSILQQLFNACDVAIAGRFAGPEALAAVGSNTPIVALFVNSVVGLAVGANVVIAQCIGRKDHERISVAVHTSVLFSIVIGIGLLVVGQFVAAPLLKVTGAPAEVMDAAVLYLRIYFVGTLFAVIYNFVTAILRSIGDTKRPMICLVIAGVLNVCLNMLFVIVLHMGVAGVAIATSISNAVSCVLALIILLKEESEIHLDLRQLRFDKWAFAQILKVGGPAAIQSSVFNISNVVLQAGINSIGTAAIAGSATAINFEYFDYFMVNSFNQAAVTFVGQNYAAGKMKRCRRIVGLSMGESVICLSLMVMVFMLGQNFWIRLYTTDPMVIEYAKIRMSIVVVFHVLICSYEILGSILRGMGKSMLPAAITIVGSVCFRIFWVMTVFQKEHTYERLLMVYPFSWILTGSMMFIAFLIIGRRIALFKSTE